MRRDASAPLYGVPAPTTDSSARALATLRETAFEATSADGTAAALQGILDRITPVVGAAFSSVFVRDNASEDVMRLVASAQWPERWRPWLSEMRVRVGSGPSGRAAAERRVIEVADVFEDRSLGDWQDVAEELGFRALVALPLQSGGRDLGAVTFYFSAAGGFTSSQRDALHIAAHQMALSVERHLLTEQLRRAESLAADAAGRADRQTVASIEAARSRDEFLANVSHELRTPLTIVLGTIDLLSEELGGPLSPAQHEDLHNARQASERLLGLVETLLALSALRRGALSITLGTFDPRVPMRDAVAAAGSPANDVRMTVVEPDTFVPSMRSDQEKVTRILSALLSNAIKFTAEGEITAGLTVAAGVARFSVRDTGPGLVPGSETLVFEEFRQGDGSPTRAFGGAGLGLPLARGLAKLLGGDIRVDSVHGKGSTFTLELPVTIEHPNTPNA